MVLFLETLRLGLNNLRLHMLRSILTTLGIILGVMAVITMVSVGEGSKREALSQLERLGARNIIVRSLKPAESQQAQGGQSRSFISKYGVTYADLSIIRQNFPDAESIVPVKSVGGQVLRQDKRLVSQVFGVTPELLDVANLSVARGRYLTDQDLTEQAMVAVVGYEVARALFPLEDPIGSTLWVDDKVVRIVGVLSPVGLSGGAGATLIGRDLNLDVHIPLTAARSVFGDTVIRRESGSSSASEVQIHEIYISAPTRDSVLSIAARLRRLMSALHPRTDDIQIIIPFELLESARKSAMTWNMVLGAIASVSLLVGGIGIMNIMLASVTERTREIGIRRALGATRKHIIGQFLVETGVLSAIGGLLGVALGIGLSVFIGWVVPLLPQAPLVGDFFDANVTLPTKLTMWSIAVSFTVATITGLIFGVYPALVAAKQDPIVALRHD